MTIFKDDFDAQFLLAFTLLMLVKAGHWLVRDRVDLMEQTVRLEGRFHWRLAGAFLLLGTIDVIGVAWCVHSAWVAGPSAAIYFANEYGIRLVSLISLFIRYRLNCQATAQLGEAGWEARRRLLFHLDLLTDLSKLSIYLAFFAVVVSYYGIPIHIFRDLILTLRALVTRLGDWMRYRQALRNFEARFPPLGEADLAQLSDRICIVCREEMGPGARRLACGHVFHSQCLRSWLERQQACPTCRQNVAVGVRPERADPAMVMAPQMPHPDPHLVDHDALLHQRHLAHHEAIHNQAVHNQAVHNQVIHHSHQVQTVPVLMVPPHQIQQGHLGNIALEPFQPPQSPFVGALEGRSVEACRERLTRLMQMQMELEQVIQRQRAQLQAIEAAMGNDNNNTPPGEE